MQLAARARSGERPDDVFSRYARQIWRNSSHGDRRLEADLPDDRTERDRNVEYFANFFDVLGTYRCN
jgi:hypothetical protein